MDSELLKKIWPVFVEEAREHLQQLSSGVLELEHSPADAAGLLDAMRRTAHGLKGSAASLGLGDIERLAHALEDALVGREKAGKLSSKLVEAMLAGLSAAEDALERGDSGGEPTVPELDTILATLVAAAGGAPTPARPRAEAPKAPAQAAPETSDSTSALEQIWPVFRSEAAERLAQLEEGLAQHERQGGEAWAADSAGTLARVAANLQSSASVLGLAEMEKLAGQAQTALRQAAGDGAMPAERLGRLRAALQELKTAIGPDERQAAASAPVAPPAALRSPAVGALAQIFLGEAREMLAELEAILGRLCSPFEGDRKAEVEAGTLRAHNLKGSAGAVGATQIAELAVLIHEAMSKLAEPGLEASRAAAKISGALVDLKAAIETFAAQAQQPVPAAVVPPEPQPTAPAQTPKAEHAPEHAAAEPAASAAAAGPADRTIRVSVATLESLARQLENLALGRSRQERRARELQSQAIVVREIGALWQQALPALKAADPERANGLEEAMQRLRQVQRGLMLTGQESLRDSEQAGLATAVIREDLKDLRMVPAATALEPLRRTVREVVGRLHKQIELVIHGGEVRLDRRILDELKNPLLHMVRNSADHGIESPQTRRALSKPETGTLQITVERRGHRVALVVADDGGGLPVEKIRKAAVDKGLFSAQAAAQLDEHEVIRLIFRSGFSTAEKVTALSGRGVGLDVVHETVSRLGGAVEVESKPGQGTRFTLELPLTLAATMAVIVRSGGELAAIPYESVERVLLIEPKELGTVAGRACISVEGTQVPFSSLSQVLGVAEGRLALERGEIQAAVLLRIGEQRVVLAIEEVVGQQEIVVHALGRHAAGAAHIGGAAVLDDGKVVAVLNAYELVRLAQPMSRQRQHEQASRRVLVADDSLTTRSAMKALLEIAGYQVLPAGDGEEAWRALQGSPCQLVVSDVQMPRLDGLGLTRRIKGDERFSGLPVILVTSLDAPADRAAGLEAGADGYLVKRDVERGKLLELVRQLLPGA